MYWTTPHPQTTFVRLALTGIVAMVLTHVAVADTTVHVSVKVVNDANGRSSFGFYNTNEKILQAFEQANDALRNTGADWHLNVGEIEDVMLPQWYSMGCDDLPAMEQSATLDPSAYKWRTDAINIYVVNVDQECGGACSFSNGITGSQEIIIINNLGIGNDGIGWLHELGHYFGLWHTFQCMDASGQPCFEHDLSQCTGAGSIDRRCDDTCPHTTNVMSYNPDINSVNAEFSRCQLDAIASQMASARGHVVSSDGAVPDPQPVPDLTSTDDSYEENDTSSQSRTITAGSHSLQGLDDDWFAIGVDTGTTTVEISGSAGDLDLYIFDSATQQELGRSEATGSNESVEVSTTAGTLLVAVIPYEGQSSEYTLSISVPEDVVDDPQTPAMSDDDFEDNDTAQRAALMAAGSYSLEGLDNDWFRVTAATGEIRVSISGSQGDLDLGLFDVSGASIALSETSTSNEVVQASVNAGDYLVYVVPYDGATSSYTMTITTASSDSIGPFEPEGFEDQDNNPTMCGAGGPLGATLALAGLVGFSGLDPRTRRRIK
jgi:hypothetical protein